MNVACIDANSFGLALRNPQSDFASNTTDVSFQLADTGFARVTCRDQLNRRVTDSELGRLETIFLNLTWSQIAPGNL